MMSEPIKRKSMEMGDLWWERTSREAFEGDPIRIMIELIKNCADSYEKLRQKGQTRRPFKILVKVYCSRRKSPFVEIVDNAEGMSSKKLEKALIYGPSTELEEEEKKYKGISAEKRIGLKDVLLSTAPNNSIISIKDDLVNERGVDLKKRGNPDILYFRVDKKVTPEERDKVGINCNGTVVKCQLPVHFHRTYDTICKYLRSHFMMRKLLQMPEEYEIYLIDQKNGEKRRLLYSQPRIDKVLLKDDVEIPYKNKKYNIHITINKAKHNLSQGKPSGNSGLLFYYGKYSVLDCSLGDFERDPMASKLFGEVRMDIEELVKVGEILVDEKRKGLKLDHEFNKLVLEKVNTRLREIVERGREISEYTFDNITKREVLAELNKISKEIRGSKGHGPTLPDVPETPETLRFTPVYVSIKEYEEKIVFLIINSSIITSDEIVSIKSTNPKIIVKGGEIETKREETVGREFIIKRVTLFGEEAGVRGEVFAEIGQYTTKMGVEVLENPIFYPKNGFAFVPEETTIVDGNKKKVDLIIKPEVIERRLKKVSLSSDNYNIICSGEWTFPDDAQKLNKYRIKNVIKIPIPIEVKVIKGGCVGQKAIITAKYSNKDAPLSVKVIREVSLGGLFDDIKFSLENTKKISEFDKGTGILWLYRNHPLLKKYMKTPDFWRKTDFITFVTDIIARDTIKAMIEDAVESGSSTIRVYNLNDPKEIERHVIEFYYEKGLRLHSILPSLLKTLKTEEVP